MGPHPERSRRRPNARHIEVSDERWEALKLGAKRRGYPMTVMLALLIDQAIDRGALPKIEQPAA